MKFIDNGRALCHAPPPPVSIQIDTLVPKSPQAMSKSFPGFASHFPALLFITVRDLGKG